VDAFVRDSVRDRIDEVLHQRQLVHHCLHWDVARQEAHRRGHGASKARRRAR
jgi:hypothetical protein